MGKAQLSIFLIIAVLLLLSASLYFVFIRQQTQSPDEIQISPVNSYPEKALPIVNLIQHCVEQYGAWGIQILGLQGGRIYLDEQMPMSRIPHANKSVGIIQQQVRVLEQGGMLSIPSWVTQQDVAIPSLRYMERELEQYIEQGVTSCVKNFSAITEQGFVINASAIDASVLMKTQTIIDIQWPIKVETEDAVIELERFNHNIPVNLELIHRVALELAVYELSYTYLEDHAKSIISLYSYAGGEKQPDDLPPFSHTEANLDCASVAWNKEEVKGLTRAILSQNFPLLKIAQTSFTPMTSSNELTQGVYDGFVRNYFEPLPSLYIDFTFDPTDQLRFDISPTKNGQLKPFRISQTKVPFLPSFCSLKYAYKYDLSAPVLIRIHDSESARIEKNFFVRSEGFDFYFPLELYICGNQNRRCKIGSRLPSAEDVFPNADIYDCDELGNEITLTTFSQAGRLEKVDVIHRCEGYSNDCYLGETDNQGVLSARVPQCNAPKLELRKMNFATLLDDIKPTYVLEEKKNLTVEVKLVQARRFMTNYHLSQGFTQSYCGKSAQQMLDETRYTPLPNDQVTLVMQQQALFSDILIYPTMQSVLLSSGSYAVSTSHRGEVVIEPSVYDDGEGGTYIIDYDQNPLVHQNYQGPYMLGTHQFEWSLSQSQLSGSRILFYALTEHLASEQLEVRDFESPLMKPDSLSGELRIPLYCDYCSNGVQDQDEQNTDCGGPHCAPCLGIASQTFTTETVTIPKASYASFIRPEISP